MPAKVFGRPLRCGRRLKRGRVDFQPVAGETAVRVTEQANKILCAYTRDNPAERWHRDAKIFIVFEGTSGIQCVIIGRAVTGHDVR